MQSHEYCMYEQNLWKYNGFYWKKTVTLRENGSYQQLHWAVRRKISKDSQRNTLCNIRLWKLTCCFKLLLTKGNLVGKLPTYEQGGPEIELGNFQYTNRVGRGGWVAKKRVNLAALECTLGSAFAAAVGIIWPCLLLAPWSGAVHHLTPWPRIVVSLAPWIAWAMPVGTAQLHGQRHRMHELKNW